MFHFKARSTLNLAVLSKLSCWTLITIMLVLYICQRKLILADCLK